MGKSSEKMVGVIKKIINEQLQQMDQTVICQIASVNPDGTFNVYVVPDNINIVHNIPNATAIRLEAGDYVYVFKVKNQFANSFIINKIGLNNTDA